MSSEAKNKNNRGADRSRKGNGALFGTLLTAALMATSLSPLSRSLVHAQQPSTAHITISSHSGARPPGQPSTAAQHTAVVATVPSTSGIRAPWCRAMTWPKTMPSAMLDSTTRVSSPTVIRGAASIQPS